MKKERKDEREDKKLTLPAPVWPYANTVPLNPSSTDCTRGAVVTSYILRWEEEAENTESKVNSFDESPYCISMTPSSSWATQQTLRPACFSVEFSGRNRKATLMVSDLLIFSKEFLSWIDLTYKRSLDRMRSNTFTT